MFSSWTNKNGTSPKAGPEKVRTGCRTLQRHPAGEDLVFPIFRFKRTSQKNQHSLVFAANILNLISKIFFSVACSGFFGKLFPSTIKRETA
jgi:hypothetical protein